MNENIVTAIALLLIGIMIYSLIEYWIKCKERKKALTALAKMVEENQKLGFYD